MTILVTGGAGYIGSFMTKRLLELGHEVIVADSLVRGQKHNIDPRAKFMEGDLMNNSFLDSVFVEKIDAVIHFAGYIVVGESMKDPGMYFKNNVLLSVQLFDAMQRNGVKNLIFSSTGTVYGKPEQIPIPESHPTNPDNPYAESKAMVEKILHWYHEVYGFSYAILRYFNACGGSLDGSMGEDHNPETHIIPNAVIAALNEKEFHLFGDDYDTPDGTCIRDYIHVIDLVEAHILALQKITTDPGEYIYNVGTGVGHSNKEVISKVKEISGKDFTVLVEKRREGDTVKIIADASKIKQELGFEPKHSDLTTIIETAWKFHSQHK